VTREEVSQFSPILAARAATRSELGIPRVISDLKRSIEAGERTKEISSPLGRQIRAFQDTAGAQELYKKWAWSTEGLKAVMAEWNRISQIASDVLDAHNEKRFTVKQSQDWGIPSIEITGQAFTLDPTKLYGARLPVLDFYLQLMAVNSLSNAKCTRRVVLQHPGIWARTQEPQIIDQLEVKPYCTKEGNAVWQTTDHAIIDTKTFVEEGLLLLFDTAHKGILGTIGE
jgi:hypothetical protein